MRGPSLFFTVIVLLVSVVWVGSTNAQIVLTPPVAAGATAHRYWSTLYNLNRPYVGHWYYNTSSGVFEFNLTTGGGQPLTAAGVTSNNFYARLSGLTVTSSYGFYYGSMDFYIYDLADAGTYYSGGEDGYLTPFDFQRTIGAPISHHFVYYPAAGVNLGNINVTAELKRDLFGAGAGDPTTGFILIPGPYSSYYEWITVNITPSLTIIIIPIAPSNLVARRDNWVDITLTWDDNSDSEDGFKIERKYGEDGAWAQIATVGADETTYQDLGLTPADLHYYYRVRAYNIVGNSPYSNEAAQRACQPDSGAAPQVYITNIPPYVSAGPDRNVSVGDTVTLNGTGTWDLDPGDVLTYEWTIQSAPDGSTASLSGAGTSTASFTPDVPGTYVITLTISDGTTTRTDTVTITVTAASTGSEVSSVSTRSSSGGCFIASAAYGSYDAPVVKWYIFFRDRLLLTNSWGESFVSLYYATSPRLAAVISANSALRAAVRALLMPAGLFLLFTLPAWALTLRRIRRG